MGGIKQERARQAMEEEKKRQERWEKRRAISLRWDEADATGLPVYTSYRVLPDGLYNKTACQRMGKPVQEGEKPVAYVYNLRYHGYLPLYRRGLVRSYEPRIE